MPSLFMYKTVYISTTLHAQQRAVALIEIWYILFGILCVNTMHVVVCSIISSVVIVNMRKKIDTVDSLFEWYHINDNLINSILFFYFSSDSPKSVIMSPMYDQSKSPVNSSIIEAASLTVKNCYSNGQQTNHKCHRSHRIFVPMLKISWAYSKRSNERSVNAKSFDWSSKNTYARRNYALNWRKKSLVTTKTSSSQSVRQKCLQIHR